MERKGPWWAGVGMGLRREGRSCEVRSVLGYFGLARKFYKNTMVVIGRIPLANVFEHRDLPLKNVPLFAPVGIMGIEGPTPYVQSRWVAPCGNSINISCDSVLLAQIITYTRRSSRVAGAREQSTQDQGRGNSQHSRVSSFSQQELCTIHRTCFPYSRICQSTKRHRLQAK